MTCHRCPTRWTVQELGPWVPMQKERWDQGDPGQLYHGGILKCKRLAHLEGLETASSVSHCPVLPPRAGGLAARRM